MDCFLDTVEGIVVVIVETIVEDIARSQYLNVYYSLLDACCLMLDTCFLPAACCSVTEQLPYQFTKCPREAAFGRPQSRGRVLAFVQARGSEQQASQHQVLRGKQQ